MKKLFALLISAIFLLNLIPTNKLFSDSPRMVILEEGTNASCPPCASQNPLLKLWLERNADRVIPVKYHAWWPGANDPMYLYNTDMNRGRIQYYNMSSVPSGRINGQIAPKTGNWYEGAVGDTLALTNKLVTIPTTSPITINIEFENNGASGKVKTKIVSTQNFSGLKLRIVIVEKEHYYENAGNNGEKLFPDIARVMLPDHNGTTVNLQANVEQNFEFDYNLKPEVNFELKAVVFLQDDNTKEILQSGVVFKKPTITLSATGALLKVGDQANPFVKTYSLENGGASDVSFNFKAEKTARTPADWNAVVNNAGPIVVPAGGKADINLTFTPGSTPGIGDAYIVATKTDDPNSKLTSNNITMLSSNIQSIHVNDNESTYDINPAIMVGHQPFDYINLKPSEFVELGNDLKNLKYLIWSTGAGNQFNAAQASFLTTIVNKNVNTMVVGNLSVASLSSANALGLFGVEYLGWNMEGYGYSPYTVWLAGIEGEEISEFLGTNVQGSLKSYLLPVLKIIDNNTDPILRFRSDGRYVNWKNRTDTVNIKGENAIIAAKYSFGDNRRIIMGFTPFVFVNQSQRDEFIRRAVQWLELGALSVDNDLLSNNDIILTPNPASDYLKLDLATLSASNVNISIIDMLGNKVISQFFDEMGISEVIDVSGLASGSYILQLVSGKNQITKPFVIVK
ncbi:MAG: T9SS type A sorting domain-containing protein [Candidatus Kapabacteria bacterium]|nr:T9SS type A sorting domain-containing protein [Candidatus Kapabacteria bacterium]